MNKDVKWLLASIVIIVLITSIALNYENISKLNYKDFFNVKTYPKEEQKKENDLDKILNNR
jgi:hypothetical protein